MKVNDEKQFTYHGRSVKGIIERLDSDGFVLRLLTDYLGKNESWYIGETKWFQFNIINK